MFLRYSVAIGVSGLVTVKVAWELERRHLLWQDLGP